MRAPNSIPGFLIACALGLNGCLESGASTDPLAPSAALAMADTSDVRNYTVLSGGRIVFHDDQRISVLCDRIVFADSGMTFESIADTLAADDDTENYRLLGDTLLLASPGGDTVPVFPTRENVIFWSRWIRLSGSGLQGDWVTAPDSVQGLGTYDSGAGMLATDAPPASAVLFNPLPGGLEYRQLEFTADAVVQTYQYPQGWAKAELAMFWPDSVLLADGIEATAAGPDGISFVRPKTGEVVTERHLPGNANRFSSSDPSRIPYVVHANPRSISQCVDSAWFGRFLSP